MPRNSHSPRIALAARVDLRPFGGIPLFHRGDAEAPVVVDDWTGAGGLMMDPIDAMCGHGTTFDLQAGFDAGVPLLGGAPGDLTFSIDASDHLRIDNTSDDTYTLLGRVDNTAFGFAPVDVAIPAGSHITASDWRRGRLLGGPTGAPPFMRLRRDAILASIPVPIYPNSFQDLRIGLRRRGVVADLDSSTRVCIEAADNSAYPGIYAAWWLDEDGHAGWSVPRGAFGGTPPEPITWLSDAFRQEMGASGNEPVLSTGEAFEDIYFQRFEHPMPSMCVPDRIVEDIELGYRTRERRTQRTRDGRMWTQIWADDETMKLQFRIDGPADRMDLHRHYLRRFCRRLARHSYFWLYQDWGDSRRAAERGDYSLLYTTEFEGYRGRVPLQVEGEIDVDLAWDNGLMVGALVTLDCLIAPETTS